jgi:hypothetical protein
MWNLIHETEPVSYLYMAKVKNLVDSFPFLHTLSQNIMQDAKTHNVGHFIKCSKIPVSVIL